MISEAAADGAAVVMSTTYVDEAERAGSVLMLSNGRALLEGAPSELVAAMEGAITSSAAPQRREYAWRSGASFKEWWPANSTSVGSLVEPDLEDVTVVAELSAEHVAVRPQGPP
jgi:ABC-2 type transport system ATP-binding protein